MGRRHHDAHPRRAAGRHLPGPPARQHEGRRGADVRARPQRALQPDRAARRHRRRHGGAQGPRPHRALRVSARRRRALPARHPPGQERQRARSLPVLRRGDRRRPRRHHRDHLQGGVRDRSVRRADRAVRRPGRADPRRLRDAGGGGLRAGDGLLRVRARGEADRRPDLRGRHRQHELLDLQHRRVRRVRVGPARSSTTRRAPR